MDGPRGKRWIALVVTLTLPLVACREHRSGAGIEDAGALSAAASTERETAAPATAGREPFSHEWTRVYRIDERRRGRTTLPVGYLHRRYTQADPEGRTYVVDRLHIERGYILPDGTTWQFRLDGDTVVGVDDLGNTGFDTGVKRLLDIVGGIEYERVEEFPDEE